ncbi:CRISPR-associated protein Cas1 [Caldicellulosiruptor hydrothermalis 108]|uniref:CRISPR-associated endonuclease Cas1 n=1 Tax=Caldicellulosiruptor hydrothermalis (strain DSM 18901 / VKM B-2411 / 108) TaxID=632292 RepID=E4QAC8_CALH1|nr:type I-B CRISPR-associated endonuclease Cas1b [Caldicellulosiruptor hydrothermalis]ADQ08232.1 CRISPR-associated protein Cas1 [Caldicellulosiruptor hydrothermalis 108]
MKKDLYVFNSGFLRRKDNTIMFETDEGKKYFPVEEIESVFIFGEVDINKRFLEFMTEKNICVHFFNRYEYYVGTYYPREHYNSGIVILKQVEFYNDYNKRITIARSIVEGAVLNMLVVLRYYNSRGNMLKDEIETIERMRHNISACSDVNTLMALEGNIREIYYRCFNKILDDENFTFVRRSKNPPLDRINALISFGNSLLYATTLGEIYQTQLDPRIGYLHSTNQRKFSLNLDISEIFKPIIVDRVIFSLVNKKVLSEKHFEKELNGIILNDQGKKLFVSEYNQKLYSTIMHPKLNTQVSYKRLIRMEAYKLQKLFLENIEYKPFVARW